jgi:Restriction endonuclease
VLRVCADGEQRSLREMRDAVVRAANLSPAQLDEQSDSGTSKATNRIGWAVSYVNLVGGLERPSRGQYVIGPIGHQLLEAHPDGITVKQLRGYAKPGDEWWLKKSRPRAGTAVEVEVVAADEAQSPFERVDEAVAEIHDDVASQLLTRIQAQEPVFFEQAVLDLLMAMGYGGAEGKATRTQLSNDGGIAGIIDQDALGLARVYVQAKRYASDNIVGRPAIQAFVGALAGNRTNQGVFITTSRFSADARAYADSVPTRIVLVDGNRLSRLMIRYGVGVQVKQTIQIVEIDEDFFE